MKISDIIKEEVKKAMLPEYEGENKHGHYIGGPSTKRGTKRVYSVDLEGEIHLTTLKYAVDNRFKPIEPKNLKQKMGKGDKVKSDDSHHDGSTGDHHPTQIFKALDGEEVKPEIGDILFVLKKSEKGIYVGIIKDVDNDLKPDQIPGQ